MARGLVRSVENADPADTSGFDRSAAQGTTLSALIAFAGLWKKPSPPWGKSLVCDDAPDLAAQIKRRWILKRLSSATGAGIGERRNRWVRQVVEQEKGRKRRIVGPVGWGQSLELPRASSRGGSARSLVATSQKTPLRVKRNCIAGNQCERRGLSPKLLRNPFDRVVAYFEALFLRHPSRRSPEHGDRRYRIPQSNDQLPDITPSGRA